MSWILYNARRPLAYLGDSLRTWFLRINTQPTAIWAQGNHFEANELPGFFDLGNIRKLDGFTCMWLPHGRTPSMIEQDAERSTPVTQHREFEDRL